jgi:transcription elongation factor Elf1
MITSELVREKKKLSSVKCVLCRRDTNSYVKIKKIGMSFGIVCEDCSKSFSDKEMELIHNMLTAFGGHFGLLSNSNRRLQNSK